MHGTAYEDCTYHGIQDGPEAGKSDDEQWQPTRILGEQPEAPPSGSRA